MKPFPFICRLCLISSTILLMVSGCALDRQGTQPYLFCGITSLEPDVGPCKDAYRFRGVCAIEDETATYEVLSCWQGGDGRSSAVVKANYQGSDVSESISAICPGGDPILNSNVACTDRVYTGNLFNTIPYAYEVFLNSNFIPDFLGEEIKANLRAQAQWPKQPPIVKFPQNNLRYSYPAYVPIMMALPFKKGHVSDWKIIFYHQKWNIDRASWDSPQYVTIDKVLQNTSGTWAGTVVLSLEKGKYQIGGVSAQYDEGTGTCRWDTGWFMDNPVKFYVGKLEFPHGGGTAPVSPNWPDYHIRSFESKVVLPGEKAFTGEVVDKKSFCFRWQVKNDGKKKSPRTTLSVQCQAIGDTPCPSEFPVSRVIDPIDPGSSSGQFVSVTVPAPESEAKYRFLATVNPDQAVAESNKDNNSLYSEFVHSRPKVLSNEELLKQTIQRFKKPTGKDKAAPIKKISLTQVLLPRNSFRRDEKIPLRTFLPPGQEGTVEIERQEGNLWLKSKEPVVRESKSAKESQYRLIRKDLSLKQSGKFRARAKVANGPWSNWTYFEVQ